MDENPARRPWRIGAWRIDNDSVGKHWTDSLSIIDADGGEVAVLTRGYEGDANGDWCPPWKNAALIVAAVNAFEDDLNEEWQIKCRENLRAGHAAAREIFKDVKPDPRIIAARNRLRRTP